MIITKTIETDVCKAVNEVVGEPYKIFKDSSWIYKTKKISNMKQYGKSTTINWIPNDTKEEFERNLKKYPNSKLEYYERYLIEYKLNNHGFRTYDDFYDGDTGTVYLGCSHTFGIGHPFGKCMVLQTS